MPANLRDDDLENTCDIYTVDGIRGTLKELSDYFNVDPVSVSNLLLEGISISEALLLATPGFGPKQKEEKKAIKKSAKKKSVKKKNRDYSVLILSEEQQAEILEVYFKGNVSYKQLAAQYGVSDYTIGEVIRKYCAAKNTTIAEEKLRHGVMDNSVKFGHASKKKLVSDAKPVVEAKPVTEEVPKKVEIPVKPFVVDMSDPNVLNVSKAESNSPVSTKSISDVQDFGDFIVITTTTTTVYRK